jgi:hypothetical protein
MFSGYSQIFWVNLLGFNLVWSLSIFLGNDALLIVLALLLMHMLFHKQPILELQIVLITGLIGYCVDCILTLLGFFRFDDVQGITPIWLLFLWFGFCATLRQSLVFFASKQLIAIIAGAIGGSFAYIAAAHFNAVELTQPLLLSAASIAAVWAVLFPLLIWISQSLEGYLCQS